MERSERIWGLAWSKARIFLGRYNDVLTRNDRDDIAQEATIVAMGLVDEVRDRRQFPAIVRTISRRLRCRWLRTSIRQPASFDRLADVPRSPPHDRVPCLRVCDRRVPVHDLLELQREALARLSDLNRSLLLGFHEGFCCAELGNRFGLPEQSVKVRLYRSRRTVQKNIEAMVRAADLLDVVM